MSASSNSSKPGSRPPTNPKPTATNQQSRGDSASEPHAPPPPNPNTSGSRTKSRNPSSLNNEDSTGSGSEDGVGNNGDEPVVGNVNKFCAVPPGYSNKPKRGHLIFDACFESGNIGRVDYISDFEYDLFIRPDTCNPKFRVWFNFTVENTVEGQRVIFNLVNFSKTKSLYREGMTPCVKSSSRPKWQRLPTKNVYYYKCPDHHKNYVMSFAFCFDRQKDTYQFAYCFPYTYTRLQAHLDAIEKKKYSYVKRESLTSTVQQRRLDLLTITNEENLDPGKRQKVVGVTSRVHPGESPASFVCQGLIDFLISNQPEAQILRQYIVFKVIPMLNPDGVYLGNYRSSLMGFDLNRHWGNPSAWAHPTLYAAKNFFLDLDANEDVNVQMYCDIHAHSTLMNGFMYGNIFEDSNRFERQAVFPRLMSNNCDDFSMANTNFNRDQVKAGTGRRYLGGAMNEDALCYTLEVSFYGYMTSTSSQVIPYTEEAYIKLGRNFGKTFLDYYRMTGVIPEKIPSSISLKGNSKKSKKLSRGDTGGLMEYTSNDSSKGRQYLTAAVSQQ
ncbi:cytosolic carboxypeptidase 6-like [Symsagittifera roscoffensis]|uniref:cytosolic carboxypeptidase 6-like n=1 Tax=Symsagittifera roscoffensis TaxID=84072 RepID=UPI00307B2F16